MEKVVLPIEGLSVPSGRFCCCFRGGQSDSLKAVSVAVSVSAPILLAAVIPHDCSQPGGAYCTAQRVGFSALEFWVCSNLDAKPQSRLKGMDAIPKFTLKAFSSKVSEHHVGPMREQFRHDVLKRVRGSNV